MAVHHKSGVRRGAVDWGTTGSIPDGVTVIFHWHNPSGRTGVDSATNGKYFPGAKGERCVGLPPSCADCLEIWELNHYPANVDNMVSSYQC